MTLKNRSIWICLAILALLTVAGYGPVLNHGFVYDDHTYVKSNPAVVAPSVRNVFADTYPPGRQEAALYRPVLTVSFIIDRYFAGGGPGRWATIAHVQSCCLHVITVLLLFLFLRTFSGDVAACCASALFAVHPVLTESVAWISARSDIILGLCAIAGVHVVLKGRKTPIRSGALLALLAAIAILSKESGVSLPFIWAAVLWIAGERFKLADRSTGWLVIPSMLIVLCVLAVRVAVFGALSPSLRVFGGVSVHTRYTIVFMAISRYFRLIVAPSGFTPHWPPLPISLDATGAWTGIFLVLLCLGLGITGIARRHHAGLGAVWFGLALFPWSNIAVPIGCIMAERFLYLPLIGAAILTAAMLNALQSRLPTIHARTGILIVTASVLLVFVPALRAHVRAWENDVTLWWQAVRSQPGDMVAQTALVYHLVERGDEAAMAEAEQRWQPLSKKLSKLPPATLNLLGRDKLAWIGMKLQTSALLLTEDHGCAIKRRHIRGEEP